MRRIVQRSVIVALVGAYTGAAAAMSPVEMLKISAEDREEGDFFGTAVSISGDRAVVGTGPDIGSGKHAAYVYDVPTGEQLLKLEPPAGTNDPLFGSSVGISGSTAIIGSSFDAGLDSQSAYLFDVSTGTHRFTLKADDVVDRDLFGHAVAISGNRAIVAGSTDNNGGGLAYLFDTVTGQQLHKLKVDNNNNNATLSGIFARSVAIDGDRAIVGSDSNESAYLFDVTTGQQLRQLTPQDAAPATSFGWAVGISGDMAIVGASLGGAAYLFDVTTGEQLRKLSASDLATDTLFGWSVGISNGTALVTSLVDQTAYLFNARTGEPLATIQGDDPTAGFGWSSALDTVTAIVGSPLADNTTGSAYLLDAEEALTEELRAGDADEDLDFDQFDLVKSQQGAKYLTGQPATWGDGDWDGAPGGKPGTPPPGNGRFDQQDIIAALSGGIYLTGPYASVVSGESGAPAAPVVGYRAATGEVFVDVPEGSRLTSMNIDSRSGVFTGDAAAYLNGSFDNDDDRNIFKATFGGSFGSLSFGDVAMSGLEQQVLLSDLAIIGSFEGGGTFDDVPLLYIPIPEPSTTMLLVLGAASACTFWHRRSTSSRLFMNKGRRKQRAK